MIALSYGIKISPVVSLD